MSQLSANHRICYSSFFFINPRMLTNLNNATAFKIIVVIFIGKTIKKTRAFALTHQVCPEGKIWVDGRDGFL